MKKKTFWTYLGRSLIAVILVIVISLLGIFIFDRYNPATSDFKNMYSNSYWDELDGFMSYDELKKVRHVLTILVLNMKVLMMKMIQF